MSRTPKALVKLLHSITRETAPLTDGLTVVHAAHVHKVRAALRDPNIVGIGIGNKVTEGTEASTLCVCFYVIRKRSLGRLPTEFVVPPVLAGSDGRATFTDVKVMGRFVPSIAPLVQRQPIQSAYSVGHVDGTAGTLGAIVKKNGRHYILSNSHVLAKSGLATNGDRILYPGPGDNGNNPRDWVATLSQSAPMVAGGALVNRVDAALAEVLDSRMTDVLYAIPHSAVPLTMAAPQRDMIVTKRGRTSGTTTGRIVDINCCPTLDYEGRGPVGFTGQVLCERFTDEGDSGALVLEAATGSVVGLHFGHAKGGSVFNPIQAVVNALQFTFM